MPTLPPPPILTAATYTAGGDGAQYATLEALRTATGVLKSGDTIVLNGDDNSLTSSFNTSGITISGTGKVMPASGYKRPFFDNSGLNASCTLNSDSLEFSNFTASTNGNGGAIHTFYATLSGGANTFKENSASGSGGAIYAANTVNINGGTNTFSKNTSTNGGAICATSYTSSTVNINDGTNTFSSNSAVNGGAINTSTVNISGGTNMFEDNKAGNLGGAINASTVTISGGTNTFSGNSANGAAGNYNGGAIYGNGITFSGGTNTFTGNTASNVGGAIYAGGNLTLRATDGDFIFRGNEDRVGYVDRRANAIYFGTANPTTITLAAKDGQNIYFYDPITSASAGNRTININDQTTDTGKIVFDSSLYNREVDRYSAMFGNTTVGFGELALKGNAIYGAARNTGTFTLNDRATLTADEAMNQIWANTITMNGTVDIADGGTLLLSAAQGVGFNGTLNVGLGLESSGFLSVNGNLAFGNNAVLSVYGDDLLGVVADGWSDTYNLLEMFSATGNITGLANLMFDASWFDAYDGFSYEWLGNGILFLSYNEVPEPATLLMLGLGLAGLPVVRRLRKR